MHSAQHPTRSLIQSLLHK